VVQGAGLAFLKRAFGELLAKETRERDEIKIWEESPLE